VKLDLDAAAAEWVPQQQQEAIFRIAQEALRNALQHAGAQHVTLRLMMPARTSWWSSTTSTRITALPPLPPVGSASVRAQ
jgi:hypothetical protein